ncbi:hypothetical protein ALON55S_01612 [Alishewanella longhuensis]
MDYQQYSATDENGDRRAGIGMFLALIALKTANIIVASPATLVTLGDLHSPQVLLALAGFFCYFCVGTSRLAQCCVAEYSGGYRRQLGCLPVKGTVAPRDCCHAAVD